MHGLMLICTVHLAKYKKILMRNINGIANNPGALGSSRTGSSGFFHGSVLGQETSEPQPSTGETQERHE